MTNTGAARPRLRVLEGSMSSVVVVGSSNPVKRRAVEAALQRLFPGVLWEVRARAVPSGVAAQPLSDTETLQGARQRARAARAAVPQAHAWVGIEGGVQPGDAIRPWLSFAWVVVLDRQGREGVARTGSFPLPPAVVAGLQQGLELGEADDRVFGTTDSKRGQGAVGLLSHGVLDRAGLYEQGVLLALLPFRNPDLYFPDPPSPGTAGC